MTAQNFIYKTSVLIYIFSVKITQIEVISCPLKKINMVFGNLSLFHLYMVLGVAIIFLIITIYICILIYKDHQNQKKDHSVEIAGFILFDLIAMGDFSFIVSILAIIFHHYS